MTYDISLVWPVMVQKLIDDSEMGWYGPVLPKLRFKETGNSKHFKDRMIEVPISGFPKMVVPNNYWFSY